MTITKLENGNLIFPSLIDIHTHLREPGFEYKETIKSGANAAKEGGYTTIFCMPNTNPICDNLKTLNLIKKKALETDIEIYPICAITKNLNSKEITDFKLLKENGAIAFSNDGKPIEDMGLFKEVLNMAKEFDVSIISHAENTEYPPENRKSEYKAIERELRIVEETKSKLHFAHISTKESIEIIKDAKSDNINITAETAPHYFSLTQDSITNNGRFKMNPPLRTTQDVIKIIEGLNDGVIDCIATDHAPHSIEEKLKSYNSSPFGIVGLETAFSVCYTNLVLKNNLSIKTLIEKMSINPRKIFGLTNNKYIEFNPNKTWIVDEQKFKSKCKISPFHGQKLTGKIERTNIGDFIK